MRGTYTATYLDRVATGFAKRRGLPSLDIGKSFDLIVGTSTGAIIGCGLALGTSPRKMADLYRKHGPAIFPRPLPKGAVRAVADNFLRSAALAQAECALRSALREVFEGLTLGELYQRRGIALAIPAVELSQHRSWVFKTPHLPTSNHRDDNYTLVEACLASTAAPIFRSLAAIDYPEGGAGAYNVFADGGLWANNPVLVALTEALQMTVPDRKIEIFCLGSCPYPAGEQIAKSATHRTLSDWKFGGEAAALSIDAQEFAFDHIARMLAKHVDRPCEVVRFPRDKVPAALMPFLALDDTRPEAADALVVQANTDANMTNSMCATPTDRDAQLICALFNEMEAASGEPAPDAAADVTPAS